MSTWRRERDARALQELGRRHGRKARSTPERRGIERLHGRCARVECELKQGRTIIDVQKKSTRCRAAHGAAIDIFSRYVVGSLVAQVEAADRRP